MFDRISSAPRSRRSEAVAQLCANIHGHVQEPPTENIVGQQSNRHGLHSERTLWRTTKPEVRRRKSPNTPCIRCWCRSDRVLCRHPFDRRRLLAHRRDDVGGFLRWLLVVGLIMGVMAAVAGLIDFLGNRLVRMRMPAWPHMLGNVVVLVLSLFNARIHCRDAWTSVCPPD